MKTRQFGLALGLFIVIHTVNGALPTHPLQSPKKASEALFEVYQNHRLTFFCEQPFSEFGLVPIQHCTHCPTTPVRIQWMPIVPLEKQSSHLLCYKEKLCINGQGRAYKGLRCCKEQDRFFSKMTVDLHNLVPELPFLKKQRRQYSFGLAVKPPSKNWLCQVFIDQKHKIIEPKAEIRGMIARSYLYMRDTYQLPLSSDELALFQEWHQEFPPSQWERERNVRIAKIQGNLNPYI